MLIDALVGDAETNDPATAGSPGKATRTGPTHLCPVLHVAGEDRAAWRLWQVDHDAATIRVEALQAHSRHRLPGGEWQ